MSWGTTKDYNEYVEFLRYMNSNMNEFLTLKHKDLSDAKIKAMLRTHLTDTQLGNPLIVCMLHTYVSVLVLDIMNKSLEYNFTFCDYLVRYDAKYYATLKPCLKKSKDFVAYTIRRSMNGALYPLLNPNFKNMVDVARLALRANPFSIANMPEAVVAKVKPFYEKILKTRNFVVAACDHCGRPTTALCSKCQVYHVCSSHCFCQLYKNGHRETCMKARDPVLKKELRQLDKVVREEDVTPSRRAEHGMLLRAYMHKASDDCKRRIQEMLRKIPKSHWGKVCSLVVPTGNSIALFDDAMRSNNTPSQLDVNYEKHAKKLLLFCSMVQLPRNPESDPFRCAVDVLSHSEAAIQQAARVSMLALALHAGCRKRLATPRWTGEITIKCVCIAADRMVYSQRCVSSPILVQSSSFLPSGVEPLALDDKELDFDGFGECLATFAQRVVRNSAVTGSATNTDVASSSVAEPLTV